MVEKNWLFVQYQYIICLKYISIIKSGDSRSFNLLFRMQSFQKPVYMYLENDLAGDV